MNWNIPQTLDPNFHPFHFILFLTPYIFPNLFSSLFSTQHQNSITIVSIVLSCPTFFHKNFPHRGREAPRSKTLVPRSRKKKKKPLSLAVTGILKKWQLIFYGTATNPIRIRTRQFNPVHSSYASVHYPYPVDDDQLALGHRGDVDFFPSSTFQGYQGYPYVGAASNVQASVATLDGSSAPILTNRLPGDTSSSFDSPSSSSQVGDDSLDTTRKILHDCDPQCDPQGCYGKGPTQCIACKNYRLDK